MTLIPPQDLLRSLLTYLDQAYVVNEKGVLKTQLVSMAINSLPRLISRSDLGYLLVSERIFGNVQIMDNLQTSVKAWLKYERTIRSAHLRGRRPVSHFLQGWSIGTEAQSKI